MTGKDLIRLLEKNGWSVVSVNGSHHKLRHPSNAVAVIVPVHGTKDLKIGTLDTILKQAGLK